MIRLATAPVSWGISELTIGRPGLIGPELFLEAITKLGYRHTETGPPAYFASDGGLAVDRARRHGVGLIAAFLPLRLDEEAGFVADLAALETVAAMLDAANGAVVLLSAAWMPERAAASGKPERMLQARWDESAFDAAADRLLRAVKEVRERGLEAAFHPHVATHVEAPDEVDALLERCAGLDLCIDTGHAVVGGDDPVELARRYADRIRHVHLKDVDGAVLARVRSGEIALEQAWGQGLFCAFGKGIVPLREFLATPEVRGLDGYVVLEQDRTDVTAGDLDAVRADEEWNRERVEEWLL